MEAQGPQNGAKIAPKCIQGGVLEASRKACRKKVNFQTPWNSEK